ncbi:MAG: Stp1/IreP family PP2C-type Ser/Thr phosphatase, partial [Acidimicrobiales bacterium]
MTGVRSGAATDVGLIRAGNEDSWLVAPPLFAVADGMGGHAAGEFSSATAVRALKDAWEEGGAAGPEGLADAARAANRAVWAQAVEHPEMRGMGTTLVAAALVPDGEEDAVAVVNVGDSRVYLMRDGELEQLTEDHTLVAELVAEGQIAEEEAEFHPQRHVLTRALGVDPEVDVDLSVVRLRPEDRFLLCSDGLSREVTDQQIAAVLRRLADPAEAARELVAEAKMRGGSGNITVVVIDVPSPDTATAGTDNPPG